MPKSGYRCGNQQFSCGTRQGEGDMANQSLVRHINERRLLSALRVYGPLPRAELARRLSLTRASVTGMVDDLVARRLVEERPARDDGQRRDVGRPGIDIALAPDGAHFLGVEIGVGVMRFALLDLTASPVDTETVDLPTGAGAEAAIGLIEARLAALRRNPRFAKTIRAIGVTVPGLVRSDGFVINLPILRWQHLPLGTLLDARIDLPCQIENNAHAAAFGHIYSNPQAGEGVVVYLKIGTGCGGAVIVDNKLLRGANGLGAEIGHLRVAEDGPLCSCGRRGCLETFVNLRALQRYATHKDVVERDVSIDLPNAVAERLAAGDREATAAIAELSSYLLRGLVDLTNLFNPDAIVIGGAMLPLLDPIVDRIAGPLAEQIVPGMPMPRLTISRIGPFECAIGAAAMAHHEEFDLTNIDLHT